MDRGGQESGHEEDDEENQGAKVTDAHALESVGSHDTSQDDRESMSRLESQKRSPLELTAARTGTDVTFHQAAGESGRGHGMAYSAFDDRDLKPRDSDLALVLGDSQDLWTELKSKIEEQFQPLSVDRTFSGKKWGWSLRLSTPKDVQ